MVAHPEGGPEDLLARYRPRGVRLVGAVVFTLLAISPIATWIFLPQTARDRFVPLDFVLLAFVAGLFVAAGYAVLRCRVDATEEGLLVVNGYRSHAVAWDEIARLGLPRGAPFMRLETLEDRSLNILGVQGSDGAYAREAARQLRRLHAARTTTPDNALGSTDDADSAPRDDD